MSLDKVHVGQMAERITEPFRMHPVARVDHFAVHAYLCTGFVARHHHIAQDELFYVWRGLMSMDTSWGRIMVSDDEVVVIPSGLPHLSGSLVRSIVLHFQAQTVPERKNGHGRLVMNSSVDALPKWSVVRSAHLLEMPYLPLRLAQVDEMSLRVTRCQGNGSWHRHRHHDEMLWVREGALELGTEGGPVRLEKDELTTIPRNTIHRFSTTDHALIVSLIHDEVSPDEQMGLSGGDGLD